MSSVPQPLISSQSQLPDGRTHLVFNFHEGQFRAWQSEKRIVAIIAGGRSGKTSFAPCWLWREMMRKGPGDYLIAAPNYPLIDKAVGPEIKSFFQTRLKWGQMTAKPYQFTFTEGGCRALWGIVPERQPRILFGHADEPESLEAMSAKAAILDEAGQGRFKVGSWEAVNQRVAIDSGRILITTKPYNLAWLKTLVYDEWTKARYTPGGHPDIDVIEFDSTWNPVFPRAEFDRAMASLPRWKFDMQYRGRFTRPAGLIYDCFDAQHKRPRWTLPVEWERTAGIDFGPINTAAVFLAEERNQQDTPTGRLIAYREYHPGKRTEQQHVLALLKGEPRQPSCVGGSGSEDEWRERFARAGLSVQEPPVKDVEVGIDIVYGVIARGELVVMDHLTGLIDELNSYSRVLDDSGTPTEAIEAKATYHHLDALRYALVHLKGSAGPILPAPPSARSEMDKARDQGVFQCDSDEGGESGWGQQW